MNIVLRNEVSDNNKNLISENNTCGRGQQVFVVVTWNRLWEGSANYPFGVHHHKTIDHSNTIIAEELLDTAISEIHVR
jgi:hypothetical protein